MSANSKLSKVPNGLDNLYYVFPIAKSGLNVNESAGHIWHLAGGEYEAWVHNLGPTSGTRVKTLEEAQRFIEIHADLIPAKGGKS